MYKIVKKKTLADNLYSLDIEAKRVSKSAKPGQFIIIKNDEKGERIPLTIADFNKDLGTVTVVFQTMGKSTKDLAKFNEGDSVLDFVGPLGMPSEFVNEELEELKKEKILFVCGGVGAAPVYPQVKWMKENKIDVDVIIGSRNKDLIILEEEMRKVAKNLYIATDDGSYGFKGRVTDLLEDLVNNRGKKYT
ncbi:MAG: sulfide/dihydroorotate dehydrogenase-like FAD/NAD-binding protein, partial [Clostridium sp.]